jgi:peptidoglycan hydrolase CwlO-like protein
MDWMTIIAVVVSALGSGGLTRLLSVKTLARKLESEGHMSEAQATKVLTDASVSLLSPLMARLADADKQITAMTESLRNAQAEVAELRGQVTGMSKDLDAAHQEIERLTKGS